MSAPFSWRDLLRDITRAPGASERIASTMGVSVVTLHRWVNGESKPRPHNLRQLLQALPDEQQSLLAELLEQEHMSFPAPVASDSWDQIEYPFVMQVLEMRASTPETLLFWTLCHKVFQHAIRRLDPERIGIAIRMVLCMPQASDGTIHSLRESVGSGTPPWEYLEQEAIFLGAESLAGYVVASCLPATVENLADETIRVPAHRAANEQSAIATPLLYANRVAGCLLVSSTQPNYFASPSRLALITDYTRLIALALTPEQFYPPESISLRIMPSFEVQREHLASFRNRVIALMKETSHAKEPLTRSQAEQLVWQQIEEELLQLIP
ncbi:MAG TPA: GAF domain-containing protein [Ktedonobacteraceae bacterium]|jgi:hypothetical protein|nr:GAF domain-containing protein [Ktedonobacteraceae bacterium]